MGFRLGQWAKNIGAWLSEGLNTVVLGGSPKKTTSGRLGRWKDSPSRTKRWIAKPICAVLNLFDPGHCDKVEAAEKDVGGTPSVDDPDA